MKSRKAVLKNITLSLSLVALMAAVSMNVFGGTQDQPQKPKEESLAEVEAKYVCMINNQVFDKEQIAIEVENRTYYGCCEMCKDKLRNDAKSRVATDPVSGKKVDKAKAVIGASSEGKVFYFENAENLKKFKAGSK